MEIKDRIGISKKIDLYRNEILKRNYRNLSIFTFCGMVLTGLLCFFSMFFINRLAFILEYYIFFAYFVICYLLTKFVLSKHIDYTLKMFYAYLFPIYFIGIMMGTFLDSNGVAITIMVMLCTLTMFITDKPLHLILYLLGISVVFALCSYIAKPMELFVKDLINLVIYLGMGLSVNMLTLTDRVVNVENFMHVRQQTEQDFFSRMSHDMRTPMNGIIGITALSEDECDVDVLRDNIKKISVAGQYLLELINDTLDYQKIESGKMVMECHPVGLEDFVKNIIDMAKPTAEQKYVELNYEIKNVDSERYINVDDMRLKQVIMNLLSNAVKFTAPGGSVNVTVECTSVDGRMAHNIITVSDNGVGMSEAFVKDKLFQPFSQEYNKLTGANTGTGLGLSIVKRMVDLMHGTINVESELDKGTRFIIGVDFEIATDVKPKTKNEKAGSHIEGLLGTHILLAEDNELNAEIARKLLEKAGCVVEIAKDGSQCLDKYLASDVDGYQAILMDIRMPVMDGLEATKKIRSSERKDAKSIPIIAMSANAYEADMKKSIDAGMNRHLAKPIEPGLMYETIKECVTKA